MINRKGDPRIIADLEFAISRRKAGDASIARIFARGRLIYDFNAGRVVIERDAETVV